jgi:hypothetical protein
MMTAYRPGGRATFCAEIDGTITDASSKSLPAIPAANGIKNSSLSFHTINRAG